MFLDQVEYGDGGTISLEEIVKMPRGRSEERVDDAD